MDDGDDGAARRCASRNGSGGRLGGSGRAARPLDILLLGGTGFLGPHEVDYALARGHRVTLFNRGKSAKGLYGDRVEVLIGNRDTKIAPGLEALQGTRRWDVVIDNSGYVPRHVRDSVALLKDRVGRYVYVSTVSVYDPKGGPVFDEASPLFPAPEPGDREGHRRNLRAAQGRMRPHRAGRARRQGDHRASQLHLRPGR